jgi:hypothetical protein
MEAMKERENYTKMDLPEIGNRNVKWIHLDYNSKGLCEYGSEHFGFVKAKTFLISRQVLKTDRHCITEFCYHTI